MENDRKHTLGHRAYFLFLSRKLKYIFIPIIIGVALWYGQNYVPSDYTIWSEYILHMYYVVVAGYFVLLIVQTWLEYRYYTYTFTEDALILTYGYIMRNEVAALYHQIQNVNLLRSPLDRLAGVSQIVILMTGAERDSTRNRITLPAVGKTKAKLVQKELLHRARRHVASEEASYRQEEKE